MANKWMTLLSRDDKNMLAAQAKAKERTLTDSPSLNWALGGGFYQGYATCLYGNEGSGKSLISMMAVAGLHKRDPEALAVLISSEFRAPSPEKLKALGVDPERLIVRQVNTVHDVFDWVASYEEAFKSSDGLGKGPGMAYLLHEGAPIKALVIDSIKGIKGPKEMASETAEAHVMGDLSYFLNASLRKILPIIREYDIMTILVQQVTMNMNPDEVKYQNKKWTIPGGQALKHFCETMCLVERVTSKDSKLFSEESSGIRDLPVQDGHTIRIKVEKANLDTPFREAEFRIHYNKGVVDVGLEIAKLGKGMGTLKHPVVDGKENIRAYVFEDKKWIGFDNMVKEIEADPLMQRKIMSKLY